jgi:predicted  nucleic acid-binding Zn-ribbon protein
MTETISLTEATHRYRIGEKTLRKWIQGAGIATKKPDDQNRLQWQIDVAALEKLLAEKSIGRDTGIASTSEIEALRADFEAQKQEIGSLRERVAALEQQQGKGRGPRRANTEEKSLWDAFH